MITMSTNSNHNDWMPNGFEEYDYIYDGDERLIAGGRKRTYIRKKRRSSGKRMTKVKRRSKRFSTKRRNSLRGGKRSFLRRAQKKGTKFRRSKVGQGVETMARSAGVKMASQYGVGDQAAFLNNVIPMARPKGGSMRKRRRS